ncbi:inositol polyphosphate 1-phosphatase [Neodiprion virginianus]|uniref:inositol polyphosphate 1-phosphatase n=1 Tax=Neodiprion virginianus TaxID=2961670 RepID=UPI001EE77235|nr:inositol polyphosphate 1-phosphatase [Neodiprion virginianus]XP_046617075.1 inositol polyphosphate 1-phosphatase [Neodiprion virginianus]
MSEGSRLLECLLKVSEKAANIARVCRQNRQLFKLLVQEKSDEEKNPRFVQDFKTLADVLIQETIKHDVGTEFPDLAEHVTGEENNTFSNTLGESVTVKVCSNFDDTANLLEKVLNNDSEVANLLAVEVHREIQLSDVPGNNHVPDNLKLTTDALGIWIDPIDSTAEYIHGVEKVDEVTGVHLSGLRCVTVLIGVFEKTTGRPVLGVINQPFHNNTCDSEWLGSTYWGFNYNGVRLSSISGPEPSRNVAVLSSSESAGIKSKLSENGFTLVEAAGAGYKLLTVILGQSDIYILSKDSTFKWDTCAAQAILGSLEGGVIDFRNFLKTDSSNDSNLIYLPADNDSCNRGGIVAYRNIEILESIKKILLSH